MSASSYYSPVYRLRATATTDSYGDPVDGWAAPERVRLHGAEVQPRKSAETGAILTDEAALYVKGRADLTEADRIEFGGTVYTVDGKPIVRRGLATGTTTSANLVRVARRSTSG